MRKNNGFTLLEMLISVTIFSLIVGTLLMGLISSQELFSTGQAQDILQGMGLQAMDQITQELREAPFSSVDTAEHTTISTTNYTYSNHFLDNSGNYRQCVNPNCSWAKRSPENFTTFTFSRDDIGFNSVSRGKVYPASAGNTCPICGQPMVNNAYIDGIMFASFRDSTGEIPFSADLPSWESLVFYFPYWSGATFELRRYVFYRSDIVGATDLKALLDFDGDKAISMNPAIPDPQVTKEIFKITNTNKIRYRRSGGGKIFNLTIDMATGEITYNINDGAGINIAGNVFHTPKIIAHHITGIDFSTKFSNPYNALDNPTGIQTKNVVRITLGWDMVRSGNGGKRYSNHITTTEIYLKNN